MKPIWVLGLMLAGTAAFAAPEPKVPGRFQLGPNVGRGIGGPPPSMLFAVMGIQIGKQLPTGLKPGLRARLRVVVDVSGAVLVAELVAGSGDGAFDTALMKVAADFAPDGPHRLMVPGDKTLRKQALGKGIVLTVMQPGNKKKKMNLKKIKRLDSIRKKG